MMDMKYACLNKFVRACLSNKYISVPYLNEYCCFVFSLTLAVSVLLTRQNFFSTVFYACTATNLLSSF